MGSTRDPGTPHLLRLCQDRVHDWFEPPVQSQICSGVPSAELGPVASRQRPDAGFTSWLDAVCVHCCAPVPLQSNNWTSVLFAVPAAVTSMHLPSTCNVLPLTVHDCAALLLRYSKCLPEPIIPYDHYQKVTQPFRQFLIQSFQRNQDGRYIVQPSVTKDLQHLLAELPLDSRIDQNPVHFRQAGGQMEQRSHAG